MKLILNALTRREQSFVKENGYAYAETILSLFLILTLEVIKSQIELEHRSSNAYGGQTAHIVNKVGKVYVISFLSLNTQPLICILFSCFSGAIYPKKYFKKIAVWVTQKHNQYRAVFFKINCMVHASWKKRSIFQLTEQQPIEKWQFSPSAWETIEKSGNWREHAKSIGGSSCSTVCCQVATQPIIARSSILKRGQRFIFLCDISHFLNDGSVVLFAIYKRYLSNYVIWLWWKKRFTMQTVKL